MALLKQSDQQIKTFSNEIVNRLIRATKAKDWQMFSSEFVNEGQTPEAQANVENQWETNPVLCSFKPGPDFLGILRRDNHLVTLWKLQSDITSDEILGMLAFTEVDGVIRVYGFRIN